MPIRLSDIQETETKPMRLSDISETTKPMRLSDIDKPSLISKIKASSQMGFVKNLLAKEEKAMANLLSIPTYAVSPELREYVAKYKRGEVSKPKTIDELEEIAFGGATTTLAPFLGRTALELGSFYKPSILATVKGAGKVIKPIAKPVGKYIWKRTPEGLKRILTKQLTIGKGQPAAYQEAAKATQLERLAGAREAEEVAKTLTTSSTGKLLTSEEQRYVGRIFRGEVTEGPKLLTKPLYQELKTVANEGRNIMDKWSKSLAESGIPSKQAREVIEGNIGKYMARMYKTKIQPQAGAFGLFKNLRLRLNGLKHRKELSENVLKAMGEIKEPALPAALRVKELSTSIANNKLFTTVSRNPEWSAPTNTTGRMVQMANTPQMGVLKGKWVIPEIAEDINSIANTPNKAFQLYSQALGAWKYGKVALNPATHARNLLSNTILLDLSGTSHLRQGVLLPKVMNDYLSKGKYYKEALKTGAIGGEFIGGEVAQIRDTYLKSGGGNLSKVLNILKTPIKGAGRIYQAEEQLFKMVKFVDVLEKGGTTQLAAKEAQKWLFNYQEIPNFIKYAKQASPFITFTYKAIPRIAETIVENPLKVYKYYALSNAWNEAARKTVGMSKEEFEKQEKAMPDWMLKRIAGMPMYLMMPYKDKYGKTQVYNLEYSLPIGMAPEILEKGFLKGGISNPFYQVIADLQKNQDFRGKPIIPVGSTPQQARQLAINHVYRQLAPSLAPAIPLVSKGGYSFEKIMDAIKKRPDFAGRVRETPQVILDVLAGIKIQPMDTTQNIRFKQIQKKRDIRNLQGQLRSVLLNKGISQQEKIKKRKDILGKIQKILQTKNK